jgi:hypothetical protein
MPTVDQNSPDSTPPEGSSGPVSAPGAGIEAQDVQASAEPADGRTAAPGSVWERLTELSRLEPGWLDGAGVPPTEAALEIAGQIVTALPRATGRVHVYPTEPGGVQLEWSDDEFNHEIEIGPDLRIRLASHDR